MMVRLPSLSWWMTVPTATSVSRRITAGAPKGGVLGSGLVACATGELGRSTGRWSAFSAGLAAGVGGWAMLASYGSANDAGRDQRDGVPRRQQHGLTGGELF